MKYFYARVSTKEQNLDRQLDAAREYVSEECIFFDKVSGKKFERAEYQRMKALLKEGDEVIVKEFDRLGRNKEGVKEEIKWFKDHGVIFRCLDIPTTMIDFGSQTWVLEMVTNILIEVLGTIAEQERNKILQRQREGIDAMEVVDGKKVSRRTGRAMGRPEKGISDFQKIFEEQKRLGLSVEACCEELGISRATWYNKVKQYA